MNALLDEFLGVIMVMVMEVVIDKRWHNGWIESDFLIVVKAHSNTNLVP